MITYLKRYISIILLVIIYGVAIIISALGNYLPKKSRRVKRIIINGTFHNPNWFYAHIAPIAQSGYGEVILITDAPLDELPNLIYKCPPVFIQKIFTRALAKFIWTLAIGIFFKADIYIGYHIFPSAITALIVGKLLGSKCCYQVTSGELELAGGGYAAENKLLSGLGKESILIERFVNKVVNYFDLVIVRGTRAKEYILNNGFNNNIEVVTGSVVTDLHYIQEIRDTDVIFVGRLSEYKRPDLFIKIMQDLITLHPKLSVKMVGDGEMRKQLEQKVVEENIDGHVEILGQRKDILELMGNSKILVLTSRWEGVSIAMLEGMALGVVPVVVNVGDLSDYVINDETGYIVHSEDIGNMPDILKKLLDNQSKLAELSQKAREKVVESCDRGVLAVRWNNIIETIVS